jgi:hypothetical protein
MSNVWEGSIAGKYSAKVERIENSEHRGVLKILDEDNKVLYQKEVSADLTSAASSEWRRVITTWVQNYS